MTAEVNRTLDFEKLLKLRAIIARFGELDVARWWNSNGQLGRLGALVLRRGFPRTYRFAQARSVFAIAAQRCDELFNPPGCVTLWKLPGAIEEEFDARWEGWLDQASNWDSFFDQVETVGSTNLVDLLLNLGLVSVADQDAYSRVRRSAEGRAVPLPGVFNGTDADIALLALGFARGGPGTLAVPYIRRPDA
jgi:hypothetical protein